MISLNNDLRTIKVTGGGGFDTVPGRECRKKRSISLETGENLRLLNGKGVDFDALCRSVVMIGMDFRASNIEVSFSDGRV